MPGANERGMSEHLQWLGKGRRRVDPVVLGPDQPRE